MKSSTKVIDWQKKNKARVRAHKLAWYYKNRTIINTLYSKGMYIEPRTV